MGAGITVVGGGLALTPAIINELEPKIIDAYKVSIKQMKGNPAAFSNWTDADGLEQDALQAAFGDNFVCDQTPEESWDLLFQLWDVACKEEDFHGT